MRQDLIELGSSVKGGILAAFAMFGFGFEVFISFIPDDLNKLTMLLGVIIAFIVIPLQWNTYLLRKMQRKKMEKEALPKNTPEANSKINDSR